MNDEIMNAATHEAKDRMLRKLIQEMHALADKAVGEMAAEDQKDGSYKDQEIGETAAHEAGESADFEKKEDAGEVTDEADDLQKRVRSFMSPPPPSKGKFLGMIQTPKKSPPPQFGKNRKG